MNYEWLNIEETKPKNNQDCLIYVLYAGDDDFTIEIDRWQSDNFDEIGGFWLSIEDHDYSKDEIVIRWEEYE